MSVSKLLSSAADASPDTLYPEDVFSSYVRTGTGADVTVTTGIDMTKGYMLWSKGRSGATYHAIYDSARGVTKDLVTNSTAAETTQATGLKAVSATGHTIGSLAKMNTSGATYVDWVMRKAPKFFDVQTKVHTTGTASTVDLSTLGVVGMVTVKATSTTSNWFAWHKDLTAGNNLKLNLTDAQSTTNAYLSVSGTTLTISASAPSYTYVIYVWAHDPSADGIIQCGSFTDAGSGATINLGWEPQYILYKRTNTTGDWVIHDSMRGFPVGSTTQAQLYPNLSNAETTGGAVPATTATGVTISAGSGTYIYLAIRRPMKVPTSGTEVYNAIASNTVTGTKQTTGFPIDLQMAVPRTNGVFRFVDRLRSLSSNTTETGKVLLPSSTGVEQSESFQRAWDSVSFETPSIATSTNMYFLNFKRAKGFFEIFCWTGTGVNRTIAHNLGVAPELLILKSRSATGDWQVWFSGLASNEKLVLNSTAAKVTDATLLNSTLPTSTLISLGTQAAVNTSSATYVGYAFANLPGIQSIGTYTGNGTSQTINCGFTTGARFVLVKRTDSTGDWYVWDTARGIVAANDPHLSLNTTSAEVTTDDSIDPATVGFIVNQNTATNINVNGGSYIFLSIA